MICRLLALTAALAWTTPAAAARWYTVDYNVTNGDMTFIDRDSIITTDAGTLRAETYSVFDPPRNEMASADVAVEVNCATRQRKFLRIWAYDANRVKYKEIVLTDDWADSKPGSQAATFVDFICSRGTKADESDDIGSEPVYDAGLRLLKKLRAAPPPATSPKPAN